MSSKPHIRLGVCDMWPSYDPANCPMLRLLRSRFDIEFCDDPQFLIYSVFGEKHYRHQCLRIFFTGENVRPNWSECDYAFTFDHTDHPDHFRWPLYALYGNCSQLVKQQVDAEKILASKSKFCNFVYSNPKCRFRNRFFDLLSRYKRVDAGGKVRNNLGYRVQDKRAFLADYKFTIAFENCSAPGYTTEKIAEPMWAGSLPIYWGNPLVHLDFNPRSFINFFDYGSFAQLIERVIEVDQNDELYLEYLNQPWLPSNQVPWYAQPERVLAQFEKIFSSPRVPIAIRQPRRAPWKPWRPIKAYLRSLRRVA